MILEGHCIHLGPRETTSDVPGSRRKVQSGIGTYAANPFFLKFVVGGSSILCQVFKLSHGVEACQVQAIVGLRQRPCRPWCWKIAFWINERTKRRLFSTTLDAGSCSFGLLKHCIRFWVGVVHRSTPVHPQKCREFLRYLTSLSAITHDQKRDGPMRARDLENHAAHLRQRLP